MRLLELWLIEFILFFYLYLFTYLRSISIKFHDNRSQSEQLIEIRKGFGYIEKSVNVQLVETISSGQVNSPEDLGGFVHKLSIIYGLILVNLRAKSEKAARPAVPLTLPLSLSLSVLPA